MFFLAELAERDCAGAVGHCDVIDGLSALVEVDGAAFEANRNQMQAEVFEGDEAKAGDWLVCLRCP